ncbi:MAG: PspC domain-containing protein, partial [Kangiellaceae bacterium]|nr:PspC domain-containing protein [Kangiellaceae bacterium]
MNKVVSIEIAGQVFWIDEDAYEDLRNYLQKIRAQLEDDECADEIYKDIELRIAELLYGLHSDEKKAITQEQLDEVIEQVGFIEGEEESVEADSLPRKSYLEPQNRILAGVCAGLATRFKVPAFIIR